MKTCCICKVEKELSLFSRNKTKKDKVESSCISCWKTQRKKYEEEHKEKIKDRRKKYTEEHKEKIAEYSKIWRDKNKEKERNPEKDKFNLTKCRLKKKIGVTPPIELVEVMVLINKTKQLCKTLRN